MVLSRLVLANCGDSFAAAAVMSSAVPHTRALVDAAVRTGGPALVNLTLGLKERDALAALLATSLTTKEAAFTAAQMIALSQFLER